MRKDKKNPVWRKSYIQIVTGKSQEKNEFISCEYCGSLMSSTLMKCPHCGAPRKRKT